MSRAPGAFVPAPVRVALRRHAEAELGAVSFTEAGLFRLVTRDPDPRPYNFVFPIQLLRHVPAGTIETALRILIARHDALRTGFSLADDGTIRRRVHDEAPFALERAEIPRGTDERAALHEHIRELRRRPFDLARPPLLAARLVDRTDGPVLLWKLHHLVLDGWSAAVLLRELCHLVAALPGGAVRLDAVPLRAADVAASLAEAYEPVLRRGAGAFPAVDPDGWRLRLDRPHPPVPDSLAGRVVIPLPAHLEAALDRAGGRVAVLVAGAFAVALARHNARSDVAFTLVRGNRNDARLLGTVGYLAYGDTLEIDVGGSPTVAELEERVRAGLFGDRSGWAPYNVLVQPPSLRVVLNVHYARTVPPPTEDLVWRPDLDAEQHLFAVHDLFGQLTTLPFGRVLLVGYRPAVLDAASAERIAGDIVDALATLAGRPDARLDTP